MGALDSNGTSAPEALVLSLQWTRGLAAGRFLEVYICSGRRDRAPGRIAAGAGAGRVRQWRTTAESPRLLGPRHFGHAVAVLSNLLVAGVLVWLWKSDYSDNCGASRGCFTISFLRGLVPVLLIPLFLHATQHSARQHVGLAAGGNGGGFYGRRGRSCLSGRDLAARCSRGAGPILLSWASARSCISAGKLICVKQIKRANSNVAAALK